MVFKINNIPWNKGKKNPFITGERNPMKRLDVREKVSRAQSGRPGRNKGVPMSDIQKKKQSDIMKGRIPWNKGVPCSESTKSKISVSQIGRKLSIDTRVKMSISRKGRRLTEQHKQKIGESRTGKYCGSNHPSWKGGRRLSNIRTKARRRGRGFILISDKSPYDEPVELHHIHPSLPYVVPCPARIHKMFKEFSTHFQNVNSMLGIKFDEKELLK